MAIRDLFRRGPSGTIPPTPPTPPTLAAALADLERLADRPELAEASITLGRVLRAAFGRPVPIASSPHADPALIAAGRLAGVPAFRAGDSPPALDRDDLRTRAVAVAVALAGVHPDAPRLADALKAGAINPAALGRDALDGRPETLDAAAAEAGLDPDFLRPALRLAWLPVLGAYTAALPVVESAADWPGVGCPNCGAPPMLAESRGLERRRFLRCGVCAGDWPGDRLRCPFCGESDHRRLSYRAIEGEEDHLRLTECETCGGRLPVLASLAPLSPPGLLVAELAASPLLDDPSSP